MASSEIKQECEISKKTFLPLYMYYKQVYHMVPRKIKD